MNTIPCVYVATMKTCSFAERCKNVHYVSQLTNIKYCSGCNDVVIEGNIYKNKKYGRVCLYKHEKETHKNYISRLHLLTGVPPPRKTETPTVKEVVVEKKVEHKRDVVELPKKSTLSFFSVCDFPVLEVRTKKQKMTQQIKEEVAVEEKVVETLSVVEEKVVETLPVVEEKVVETLPVVEEKVAMSKKDKKKEYKKRKWLEAKMAEEAKIAEEKRLEEAKKEKNRQKKEARKARRAEELAKPSEPEPKTEPKEPTEEEIKHYLKHKMMREKIKEMVKRRVANV
jgi:hypothetical protein